ncbi:MAG: ROK family protein [Chloroflexi bacterium]|nr:ROK family protein [Chloroflexota bacterium]
MTADLTGRVLHEKRIIHAAMPLPDEVLRSISDYVVRVRKEFADQRLLGIGIATPGFLDPDSGDILLIGRVPGWQNFPIGSRLSMQFGAPTRIANDIDCMAFAEFQASGVSFDRNLVYVGFDEGVKASLFLNGELYKGALGNAGLIAGNLLHVEADDLQDKQAVLSIHGIVEIFSSKVNSLPTGEQRAYQPLLAIEDPRERFETILRSAAAGLPLCHAVVQLMNQTLAAAIANLIFIIQPDVFVVGGLLAVMPADLFADLEARVRVFLPRLVSHKVMIQLGTRTSPNLAALGAAHYFLDHLLIDQEESQLLPYLSRS